MSSINHKYPLIRVWKLFNGSFIPEWLEQRKEVSHGAKIIYARLCRHEGEYGECKPKLETLAQKTGNSLAQVKRYIKELKELSLIASRRLGKGCANRYYFQEHPWMFDSSEVSSLEVSEVSSLEVSEVSHPIIRESVEENQTNTLSDKSDCMIFFDRFWKEYPIKEKKPNCIKIFQKLKPDIVLFEKIMNGLKKYKLFIAQQHSKGFKRNFQLPSTWLNGEGWNDEYRDTGTINSHAASAVIHKSKGLPVIEDVNWSEIDEYRKQKKLKQQGAW